MGAKNIKISIKWVVISIFAVIIAFITSRLLVEYINEFLRINWQYRLFEKDSSNIVFANYIMFLNLALEVFLIYIFCKRIKS